MSHLTQAELEALQASDLPRDTPLVLRKVSHSYFSTARLCGGCKINGNHYTYVPTTDELIRDDVVKFLAKLRRKPKQAAKQITLFKEQPE